MSTINGLYAITDESLIPETQLTYYVEQSILGGASVVQFRNKNSDFQTKATQAEDILKVCNLHSVPLIINDDITLCAEVGADGVHLGQEDSDISVARELLGSDSIIGVTCHNSLDLAIEAQKQGANYVAFGRFFASQTKPDAKSADISILKQARLMLSIPTVAIGGITADNAKSLIDAGASSIAVVGAVFADSNPKAQAERLSVLFKK